MKQTSILAAAGMAIFLTAPVLASETLTATFTQPDGGVTVNTYDNTVLVTVSGVGQSAGTNYNDAFYVYADASGAPIGPTNDPDYYQLTFGTSALVGFDPAQDAKYFLVGSLPAYNPNHIYMFELDTGTSAPSSLHFGVSDGNFSDNSGFYTITVSEVPEPSTWAMMLLGFAGLAFAAFRSRIETAPVA